MGSERIHDETHHCASQGHAGRRWGWLERSAGASSHPRGGTINAGPCLDIYCLCSPSHVQVDFSTRPRLESPPNTSQSLCHMRLRREWLYLQPKIRLEGFGVPI